MREKRVREKRKKGLAGKEGGGELNMSKTADT